MKFLNCEDVRHGDELAQQVENSPNYQKELWFKYQKETSRMQQELRQDTCVL